MTDSLVILNLEIACNGTVIAAYENVPLRVRQFIELDISSGYIHKKLQGGLPLTRNSFISLCEFLFDVLEMCSDNATPQTHSVVIGNHTYKATLTTEELK